MNMAERCPKCSAPMGGPRYEEVGNRLRYTCNCGYSMTRPALDSATGWDEYANDLREAKRQLGQEPR